jgi:hypothetical protein
MARPVPCCTPVMPERCGFHHSPRLAGVPAFGRPQILGTDMI